MQDKAVYLKIGKNIRKYRMQRGLSQEKLSELISANEKFIGHIERAERTPSLKKLVKVAQVLEIEMKYLFDS